MLLARCVNRFPLSNFRRQLRYAKILTPDGIPAESFNYLPGNRSALEWVAGQYRAKTGAAGLRTIRA